MHGIKHQKTPPKSPRLNGLVERMNRTLTERASSLLLDAKLLKLFWGEALCTIAHNINLTPIIALGGDVPDKVWYGKDVYYDHLDIFEYKCSVHVPKVKTRC